MLSVSARGRLALKYTRKPPGVAASDAEIGDLGQPSVTLALLKDIIWWARPELDCFLHSLVEAAERARRLGYYPQRDFIRVCRMKSPLAVHLCAQPSESAAVEQVTREAVAMRCPRDAATKLCEINGVGVPTASALLAAYAPRVYPIVDIRTWQALWCLRVVDSRRSGRGLTADDYDRYTQVVRAWSRALDRRIRHIEVSLFRFHRDFLQGPKSLYDPRRQVRRGVTHAQRKRLVSGPRWEDGGCRRHRLFGESYHAGVSEKERQRFELNACGLDVSS
jgi:hypothetical protein